MRLKRLRNSTARLLAVSGFVGVAFALAGCQIAPPDQRFSSAALDDLPPTSVRFPVKFIYPDTTDFGYPLYDSAVRSDLNLRSISCRPAGDGRLVILASVRNMGSEDVYRMSLLSGDLAAFRIAATLTSASGATERVVAIRLLRLDVASEAVIALTSVQTLASDVKSIDVVVDPDRVVPDPVRDNNILSWRGNIDAASPQCLVQR